MNKNQHVVPIGKQWGVKSEGSDKYTRITQNQKDASIIARKIARNEQSELVIHGRDGRIRERNSYGNDPFPPKG